MAVTTALRIRGTKCRGKERERKKLFQAFGMCGRPSKEKSAGKKSDGWGIERQVLKEQMQSARVQLWKRKLPMPRNKATSKYK